MSECQGFMTISSGYKNANTLNSDVVCLGKTFIFIFI